MSDTLFSIYSLHLPFVWKHMRNRVGVLWKLSRPRMYLPLGSYYLDFKTQWPCWRHFLLVRIWEELFDRPSAIHLFMLWLFIAAALYISHLLSRAFISSFRPCCYFAFCRARCSPFNLVQLFLVKNTVITEKEISRQQPDTFFLFQHTCKKRNNSKWCSNVTPVRLNKC